MKVPAFVVVFPICIGIGAVGGVLYMVAFAYEHKPQAFEAESPNEPSMGKGGPKGGGGQVGIGKGGLKGDGLFGKGGGNAGRTQLAELIAKLDLVANAPPAIAASSEECEELVQLLDGLDQLADMNDKQARARLNALMISKLVQREKETLRAAGYVFPGSAMPFGGGGNAFDAAKHGEHLKSLQAKLAAAKPS